MSQTASDRQLMNAVASDDLAAFGVLAGRHLERLLRFAACLAPSEKEAAAAVAKAFAGLFLKRRLLPPSAKAAPLLFSLCAAEARALPRPARPAPPAGEISLSLEARKNRLRSSIASLPWSRRLALLLVFFENLPAREAAALLGEGEAESWDLAAQGLKEARHGLGPGFFGFAAPPPHLDPSSLMGLALGHDAKGRKTGVEGHAASCGPCKKALLEAEALKALYLETAPRPPASLARRISGEAAKAVVAASLSAKISPSQARELLGPRAEKNGFTWGSLWPVLVAGAGVVGLGALLFFRSQNQEPAALPVAPSFPILPAAAAPAGGAEVERAAKKILIEHSQRQARQAEPETAPPGARLEVKRSSFDPDKGGTAYFLLSIPGDGPVELRFLDAQGKTLRLLKDTLSGPAKIPVIWNGTDSQDQDLPAGEYYLRVITPWFSQTEKIELKRNN